MGALLLAGGPGWLVAWAMVNEEKLRRQYVPPTAIFTNLIIL